MKYYQITVTYKDGKKFFWSTTAETIARMLEDEDEIEKMIIKRVEE